jgi:hypothetical protein
MESPHLPTLLPILLNVLTSDIDIFQIFFQHPFSIHQPIIGTIIEQIPNIIISLIIINELYNASSHYIFKSFTTSVYTAGFINNLYVTVDHILPL